MNLFARHTSRFRRSFSWIGLAIALGIGSLAITQCRMVQDSVTGVDLRVAQDTHGRSDCIKRCRQTLKVDRKKEQARFQEARKACGRDRKCIKGERALHKEILKDLVQDFLKCKKGCYNEGGGKAGS